MDTGMLLLALLVFGVLVFLGVQLHSKQVRMIVPPPPPPPAKPTVVVVSATNQGAVQQDPRFPLAPERSFDTPPDLRGDLPPIRAGGGAIPINQMTRGAPEQYQQIGVLTAPGGSDTSASPSRTILPLFGRKLITNRDRWNYYTRTDGLNPVQVPVHYKRRNCDDDNGCDEIMEGESVSVPILGQSYIASVYRYSTPRYIPY
jgi:hypothetical protein